MKITIAGGGITGLTTALSLYKLGFVCQVYERSPELAEVGAGIWLQPNAMKILNWLGLGDKIRSAGMLLNEVAITQASLKPIRKANQIIDSSGNQIISIHRASLQKIFFDALPKGTVHLGRPYEKHRKKDDILEVVFADRVIETDILIGADGIHSKVRQQLFPTSSIRYSGQTCWRGISTIQLSDELNGVGREAWGNKIRFGFAAVSDSQVYWFAVAKAIQNQKDEKSILKQKLLQTYRDFNPVVADIIHATPDNKIIRNDLTDLKRLSTWYQDQICLLGDAAHATTPNMGQGAGQGIEDAYYFSKAFAKEKNHQIAFQNFEKHRRKKVDYIVNTSWRFGQMAHQPIAQAILKFIMKISPEKVMQQQMKKIFTVEGLG